MEPRLNEDCMAKTGKKQTRRKRRVKKRQRGGLLDIQKLITKTGKEFHWPKMNYLGPGTHLEKRLKRGDVGKNRLDELAKIHDIDYSLARNIKDKWKADDKMIRAIQNLPGKKTKQERIVKTIMQTKRNSSCNVFYFNKQVTKKLLCHFWVRSL